MVTKKSVISAASESPYGGFVNTDGEWCMTRTPDQFKRFLEERLGFIVTKCQSTNSSTAIATTVEGIQIFWNGFCKKL